MRSLLLAAWIAAVLPTVAIASDTATGVVVVSANFSSRTSLRVSTELLQFDVAAPGQPATALVEFSAAARTSSGAEVVLSVEPVRAIEGPGGAGDVESAVTFAGEGEGTTAGALATNSTAVAGRWIGSGRRTGRLVFSLRAGVSGTYAVPVRFVLSAP